MSSEFVLKVQDIDEEGRDFAFPIEAKWIGTALDGCGVRPDPSAVAGSVTGHAKRSGADVLVRLGVRASFFADCYRCLGDARVSIEAKNDLLFTARGASLRPEADEEDLTAEELAREFFKGDKIVLDDIVHDEILLAVPMQPLCAPDCAGIPIPEHVRPPAGVFGTAGATEGERPVDPRLLPLQELAAKTKLAERKKG